MAQRKPPSAAAKKTAAKKAPAKKTGARPATTGRPPTRKPGKSIVNQRQTPWTLIAIVAVLVLFAGGIVAYAVTRHKSGPQDPYKYPEVAAAKQIKGIIYHPETQHTHVPNQSNTNPLVKYDMSPPIGGNHSAYWAYCNGVTYDHQIANENAVHMLEHGTVWITYNPDTLSKTDVDYLKTHYIDGIDRMALSPYKGLKTPISLQAWGYQLFLSSPKDPRIQAFVNALRHAKDVTPEPNAGCDPASANDGFKATQSYPGHPFNGG